MHKQLFSSQIAMLQQCLTVYEEQVMPAPSQLRGTHPERSLHHSSGGAGGGTSALSRVVQLCPDGYLVTNVQGTMRVKGCPVESNVNRKKFARPRRGGDLVHISVHLWW
jgi:hypothetical protein